VFGSDLKIFTEVENCRGKIKKWSFLNSFGVSPERRASASATGVELLRAFAKARRKLSTVRRGFRQLEEAFDSQKRLSKI